jgi:hypothetical protein
MSRESAMTALAGESVTTPPVVASAEQTPAARPEVDSAVMAAYAKKEAEFVRRQEAFKKEREAWEKTDKFRADEVLKKAKLFEETKGRDQIEALKLLGYTETDIFNMLARVEPKEKSTEERAIEAAQYAADQRIKEFEDNQKKQTETAMAKRDQDLITGFKSDMGKVIGANKEKYEYCSYYGPAAEALAYETVLQIVRDSKGADIPTAEEAIAMVEEYYEEQDKAMSQLKKRQPKVETAAPENKPAPDRSRTVTTPAGSTPPKPTITKTRTLSNAAVATAASGMRRANETPSQKKERLIEALKRGSL